LFRSVPGERRAASDLHSELEELVDRRQPFQLQAVVLVLAAEERLVRKRGIDEFPRVRVLAVQVSDAG
jgi:hypothetical protein